MGMFDKPRTTWAGTRERKGEPPEEIQGTLDPYEDLFKGPPETPLSSVSANYSRARDFSAEKISFHVTVHCKQNEPMINEAGKRALMKVLEFTKDAMEQLGWKEGQ